jgi:branched-chain amino acid transport system permease protein
MADAAETSGRASGLWHSLVRSFRKRPIAWLVIFATVVLAVIIGEVGGLSQVINTIVTGGMWALLATGLALILGVMNIPNFFHGESFMVGSYTAYFVFTPLNKWLGQHPIPVLHALAPFVGFIAAALAGFVLGVILEKLVSAPTSGGFPATGM